MGASGEGTFLQNGAQLNANGRLGADACKAAKSILLNACEHTTGNWIKSQWENARKGSVTRKCSMKGSFDRYEDAPPTKGHNRQ
ncbi:5020_t:CDS:2 [Acaulospora morrowiae]|uniref:5020_t:CDS:1 n=1 Tax=Acaulospora morrowiae TaxID=94023 RepID=A0A9N9EX92_9GLOM|nr:5020_t:CDS:2 [Acaulospora morrowiae]